MTTDQGRTRSGRTTQVGTRHAVAAGHHLSAEAAIDVLEGGGNAVDAGVAAGLVTGVVEASMVSVAGVAPILIRMAETGEVVTIDGLGTWPKAASCAYFQQNFDGAIPQGLPRAVMPAAPDAWLTALERYGTMSFAEVAEAAIRAAREGFPAHRLMVLQIGERQETIRAMPDNAAVFMPKGRPPEVGEPLVQTDLAGTLQFLADEDMAGGKRGRVAGLQAVREAFYKGDIARAIAHYHADNGGLITRDDLAAFRVNVEAPQSIRLGKVEVYTCLKLGFSISPAAVSKYMVRYPSPPSQSWRTFLTNHADCLASIAFFVVPTATFHLLFGFIVLHHERRQLVHFGVTANPTMAWVAQRIREAFPWGTAPRYLIRDRDGAYGQSFRSTVTAMGVEEVVTAPRSPWQNPYVERLIGSVRRECLDHSIILNERHLRRERR